MKYYETLLNIHILYMIYTKNDPATLPSNTKCSWPIMALFQINEARDEVGFFQLTLVKWFLPDGDQTTSTYDWWNLKHCDVTASMECGRTDIFIVYKQFQLNQILQWMKYLLIRYTISNWLFRPLHREYVTLSTQCSKYSLGNVIYNKQSR